MKPLFISFLSNHLFHLSLLLLLLQNFTPSQTQRVVKTKQGFIRGLPILPSHSKLVHGVTAFLGVPYASPPIGQRRFMPPSTAESWSGIKDTTFFSPVCPQLIPNLNDEKKALMYMTIGRLNYLKNLVPYLRNQSEDCLYLNIYVPDESGSSSSYLPIVVFIHGESYEWNSGNPYDGSILSSYGQVIVITLNYRLGILGFLKPALDQNVISNFGLLDLVAALQWIRENIVYFHGNLEAVTVIGHGTGAALLSFLMASPVLDASGSSSSSVNDGESRGLFHRAILMSGSFLNPMALTKNPQDITVQVANQLGCPLDSYSLLNCLRGSSVKDLLHVKINVPLYNVPFGPSIDGIVIKESPEKLLRSSLFPHYFGKYDIIFGVTELESFHMFPALSEGVTLEYLETILTSFLLKMTPNNIQKILSVVIKEYRDNMEDDGLEEDDDDDDYTSSQNSSVSHTTYRDVLLQIFSDVRVVAPLFKLAYEHSKKTNRKTYMYVFKHQTTEGYYTQAFGSLHGEEIPYFLGYPLTGGAYHYKLHFTPEEKILSEVMMSLWVLFIRNGHLNSYPSRSQLLSSHNILKSYIPRWPLYDIASNQEYLSLDLESVIKSHYRATKINLWNGVIPGLQRLRQDHSLFSSPPPPSFSPPLHPPNIFSSPYSSSPSPPFISSSDSSTPFTSSFPPNDSSSPLPLALLLLLGFSFCLFNLLSCILVSWKSQRVKRREESLQSTLSRLSLQDPKLSLGDKTNNGKYNQENEEENDENEERRKSSLRFFPSILSSALSRARGQFERPPSPIIEMVPIYRDEPLLETQRPLENRRLSYPSYILRNEETEYTDYQRVSGTLSPINISYKSSGEQMNKNNSSVLNYNKSHDICTGKHWYSTMNSSFLSKTLETDENSIEEIDSLS